MFSEQAGIYAAARPRYPEDLFRFLASLAPASGTVWDCATGNGQAAVDLARCFARVIATDASPEQLSHASPHPRIEYRVATAEASGLPDASVNLVTVAQALHWLDHARFYKEVRRVSHTNGVIAAWCYGSCHAGKDVEAALREFEDGTVGRYWHPGRRWVVDGYRTMPFPFREVPAPAFELRTDWSLSQLGEYLRSWSAVAAYRRDRGVDPVTPFLEQIVKQWGPPERTRVVVWPLGLRVGRVE